jgi:hypothetical protein
MMTVDTNLVCSFQVLKQSPLDKDGEMVRAERARARAECQTLKSPDHRRSVGNLSGWRGRSTNDAELAHELNASLQDSAATHEAATPAAQAAVAPLAVESAVEPRPEGSSGAV